MARWWSSILAVACLVPLMAAWPAAAQTPSSRIALVIGNGAYAAGAAPTAPNDAGLVAQTLTAAGFDVAGARDLGSDAIRSAFRDFLTKAGQLGPDGIAFVYLAGYAVQYEGDNYYVPTDATLGRDLDVAIQAIRVSDLTRALSGVQIQARVVVIDGAYKPPFPAAPNLAGGLALIEPEPGTMMAFNAAPGTLGPVATEAYGVYGQAMAEMLRQGGIPVQEVFDRIRLRVNAATKGADVPWSASRLTGSFVFLDRAADAPAEAGTPMTTQALEQRPIKDFPVDEAYNAAVARDTFQGYLDFLAAYPTSPYARRVRALVAARREALTWRRTTSIGTSAAYWSYLRRYPKGPHGVDARRRLQAMSVALMPPPDFAPIEYDVPPPPEDEYSYVDAPVIVFGSPDYGPPPPPPPAYFLPPPETEIYELPPPPRPAAGFLPIPVPIPIPFARPLHGPGQIRPVQGVGGAYAQPQPFVAAPSGGLAPRGGSPTPAAGVPAVPPRILPGQAAPAGQPGLPGIPAVRPTAPGLPAQPLGQQHLLPGQAGPGPGNPGVPPRGAPGQAVPAVPPTMPGAPNAHPVGPAGLPGANSRQHLLPGQAGALPAPPRPGALPATPGLPQRGPGGTPPGDALHPEPLSPAPGPRPGAGGATLPPGRPPGRSGPGQIPAPAAVQPRIVPPSAGAPGANPNLIRQQRQFQLQQQQQLRLQPTQPRPAAAPQAVRPIAPPAPRLAPSPPASRAAPPPRLAPPAPALRFVAPPPPAPRPAPPPPAPRPAPQPPAPRAAPPPAPRPAPPAAAPRPAAPAPGRPACGLPGLPPCHR